VREEQIEPRLALQPRPSRRRPWPVGPLYEDAGLGGGVGARREAREDGVARVTGLLEQPLDHAPSVGRQMVGTALGGRVFPAVASPETSARRMAFCHSDARRGTGVWTRWPGDVGPESGEHGGAASGVLDLR